MICQAKRKMKTKFSTYDYESDLRYKEKVWSGIILPITWRHVLLCLSIYLCTYVR